MFLLVSGLPKYLYLLINTVFLLVDFTCNYCTILFNLINDKFLKVIVIVIIIIIIIIIMIITIIIIIWLFYFFAYLIFLGFFVLFYIWFLINMRS